MLDVIQKNEWSTKMFDLQKQPLELFYKKAVLKNYTIIRGKDLRCSLILIKLQGFSCENCKIFKNICSEEHLRTAASKFI